MNRRQVLTTHYFGALRRVVTWAGLVALLGTTLVASPAAALGTQMGARSVTPTTLKAGVTANTSYAISFKPSATAVIGSMQIEICDSPLESVACAASGTGSVNSNGADASGAAFVSMTGTNCTGGTWAAAAAPTPGPGTSGTARRLTNSGAAVTPTAANACTVTFSTIKNPIGNNQHFYLRLTTYLTTTYTSEADFGGFALMTAQDLTINASVQEQLAFCVGATVAAGCGSVTGGAISLTAGGGTCPIMTTANACTNTSQMAASTNANSGYTITYNGTTFTAPVNTIPAIGSTPASSTPGTEQFGLAGTTKSGSASGTFNTTGTSYDYATNGNKYAYVTGSPQTVAGATVSTIETVYTVTYLSNVNSLTEAGLYTATINYVCTGLF